MRGNWMTTRHGLLCWLRQRGRTLLTSTLVALTAAALVLPVAPAVSQKPATGFNQPNPLIDPPEID